jgi:hypothetical protein
MSDKTESLLLQEVHQTRAMSFADTFVMVVCENMLENNLIEGNPSMEALRIPPPVNFKNKGYLRARVKPIKLGVSR